MMSNTSNYSPKGPNIYKSFNQYRVRVSVGGNRFDTYVPTLREARSLRKEWKAAQKASV